VKEHNRLRRAYESDMKALQEKLLELEELVKQPHWKAFNQEL